MNSNIPRLPRSVETTKKHILIVESAPLFADMLRMLMLHAPGVGRVSILPSWEDWRDINEKIHAVFTRSEQLPEATAFPEAFFKNSSAQHLVILGKGTAPTVNGVKTTLLPPCANKGDLYYALGLVQEYRQTDDVFNKWHLTDKEHTVVCLTAKGYSLKEIADQIDCTVSTVQSYRTRAMEKIEAATLADLCVIAAAQGWRDCPCQRITPNPLPLMP